MAFRINSRHTKQTIGIQVTFITEQNLKKEHFLAKNTVFYVTYVSILNPCYDGNGHTYATTKEMKTMEFRINNENTKQASGIQVTFMTKQNLPKECFLAKKHCFLVTYTSILNPC